MTFFLIRSIYGKIEQRYEHKDDRKQVNKVKLISFFLNF